MVQHSTSKNPESPGETGVEPILAAVHVREFRSIRDASFRPGPVSAFVGDPGTGKSNILAAIRAALDPDAAPLADDDMPRDRDGRVHIRVETADGSVASHTGSPHSASFTKEGDLPPSLYLPAHLRAAQVVAATNLSSPQTDQARSLIEDAIWRHQEALETQPSLSGTTEAARGLVEGIEACREAGLSGMILLIEEPELFLPPQVQRYLYRLLRELAACGNQIIYSTHSPSFLNVARLNELVLTEHRPEIGTKLVQPEALPPDEEFKAYSEFDASRSELFLARAAVLVEGLTEKLALPFVFRALGYDPDKEQISIVECGGKSKITIVAQVCKTVGIPFVVVHDRDAPQEKEPSQAERQLNQLLAQIAGQENRIELAPDFEAVAGLRGRRHKPARAWLSFTTLQPEDVPAPLAAIVHRAVKIGRNRDGPGSGL